jgi:hypothetical protein
MWGTGCEPDPVDERDRDYALGVEHLPVGVPPSATCEHLFGVPFDQNGHNSCITQGIAKAMYAAHLRAGHADPPNLCRFLLWAQLRGEAMLQDNVGSYIRKGFKKLNAEGFCKEEYWPHDTDTGPEARFRKKPSRNARRMAHDQREAGQLTVYRRIYETGADRIERVKGCIANDQLVVFGTSVDRDFVQNHFDAMSPLDPPRSDIAGGHCMDVVAYDADTFLIGNSYSTRWGRGGFCYFTADYLTDLVTRDLWTVEKAPWFTG